MVDNKGLQLFGQRRQPEDRCGRHLGALGCGRRGRTRALGGGKEADQHDEGDFESVFWTPKVYVYNAGKDLARTSKFEIKALDPAYRAGSGGCNACAAARFDEQTVSP